MLGCLLIKIQKKTCKNRASQQTFGPFCFDRAWEQVEFKIVGIWKTTGKVRKEYLMRSWLFFYRYILLLQFFFAVQKKFPNLRCIFSLARCFFLWFLFLCLKGGLFLWYFVDIKWQKLDHKRQIMYWKRRCKVHKVFGSKMQCYWKFCWPTQN